MKQERARTGQVVDGPEYARVTEDGYLEIRVKLVDTGIRTKYGAMTLLPYMSHETADGDWRGDVVRFRLHVWQPAMTPFRALKRTDQEMDAWRAGQR